MTFFWTTERELYTNKLKFHGSVSSPGISLAFQAAHNLLWNSLAVFPLALPHVGYQSYPGLPWMHIHSNRHTVSLNYFFPAWNSQGNVFQKAWSMVNTKIFTKSSSSNWNNFIAVSKCVVCAATGSSIFTGPTVFAITSTLNWLSQIDQNVNVKGRHNFLNHKSKMMLYGYYKPYIAKRAATYLSIENNPVDYLINILAVTMYLYYINSNNNCYKMSFL